ncbi:MAG: hypothetical protein IPI88_07360 [Chitinophagaceae bacterium]|nr:hypothetical protein [Chitinophagaceae bacterium]
MGSRGDGSYLGNVRFGKKTSEFYQRNIEFPFFNFYLKLRGTVHDIAEANVFFTGENEWRRFNEWPSKNIDYRHAFLLRDNMIGIMGDDKPIAEPIQLKVGHNDQVYSEYISDPAHPVPYTEDVGLGRTREYMSDDQRFASRRPDVLSFSTGILKEDLTLAGPLVADLMVSISTTDADFVVKLIDVFPDDFKYDEKEMGKGNGQAYPHGGLPDAGAWRDYEGPLPQQF